MHDTGSLTIVNEDGSNGEVYQIVNAIKVGKCVLHILDKDIEGDIVGKQIKGSVDKARRN